MNPLDEPSLQSKIDKVLTKVEQISKDEKSINRYRRNYNYHSAKETSQKGKSHDYEVNKKVSSLFSKCANLIVQEAETSEGILRSYKNGVNTVLDNMNNIYEKELQAISPKPFVDLTALDFKFDHKEHFASFLNKPVQE